MTVPLPAADFDEFSRVESLGLVRIGRVFASGTITLHPTLRVDLSPPGER